jgi:predicted glycoside hydrolase/deacetylase ChbG (UPF0249 family)
VRRLIVNADDLGYTEGVNRGIAEAHRAGIVTSTTLMVDRPAAAHGVELVAALPRLGLGLHAVVDGVEPGRCEEELERQLARFRELAGRQPTHLDSHHHTHRGAGLLPRFEAFADRHGLPLRDRDVRHEGGFYGAAAVTVERLLGLLDGLAEGTTELGTHPGRADGLDSRYTTQRELELATLTDPRVRARVEELGIELVHWGDA